MATKQKSKPTLPDGETYLDRFKKLKAEGKTAREIGEICKVSDTTVRKYLREGKPPRKYNRSVLNCGTGQPCPSSDSGKVMMLKAEIKTLKDEIKANEKKYRKADDDLAKAKAEIRSLTMKYKEVSINGTAYEEQLQKVLEEKTRLSTIIQKVKHEGHETKNLKRSLVNNHLHEIESKGFEISHPDHPGAEYSWSKFHIK